MMRLTRSLQALLALGTPLLLVACVDEDPTDVGDALLSGNDVVTFEVVLPASEFLLNDTAFSGYVKPIDAAFAVVANSFENVLDANTLFRFSLPPRTIVVRTTGTTTAIDSAPRFVSGRVVVRFDTLTATPRPLTLRLFQTTEAWDPSATWINRVDTSSVQLPWSTPGGTRGPQIDTATWAAGDSVVFDVDSATLAVWNDSTNQSRGAILISDTDGSRARVIGTVVHVDARSSIRADTVVNVDLVPTIRTFVYNPVLPTPFSGIRIGGIHAWRSILRLRPDLRSLVFPCTGRPAGCTVSLDSVHVNTAELLLPPLQTPPGFLPEDSLFIEARPLSLAAQVPLERSPVGSFAATVRSPLLAPTLFSSPTATDLVKLNITALMVHLLDESVAEEDRVPPFLALLQLPEGGTFGFASFGEPLLRLVLTTSIQGGP